MRRPEIQFIPASTDERKIRFFGTLMPALLLIGASPIRFAGYQVAAWWTPRVPAAGFIATGTDDAARIDDVLVFVHRWRSNSFDPFAFARARLFLSRLTRMLRREGYAAEPLGPLSPQVNLPRLAARAGLGDLSPYGLLVHPAFGPRLVLTAVRTDHPADPLSKWQGRACTDCMACVRQCPQAPEAEGVIDLGQCHGCAICLAVCPVGAAARAWVGRSG